MDHILAQEAQRAVSYRILADCYYPPDKKLLKALGDLGDRATPLLSEVAECVGGPECLQPLAVDYAKLFVGPYGLLAPPYGSVYLEDGRFMGDSTVAVRTLYDQEQLALVVKDAPDHIAMELEFMHFLILRLIEAAESSDTEQVSIYRQKQRSFLAVHLGGWIPQFTENIEKHAQTSFYRTLGRATRIFVAEDMESLDGRCGPTENADHVSLDPESIGKVQP